MYFPYLCKLFFTESLFALLKLLWYCYSLRGASGFYNIGITLVSIMYGVQILCWKKKKLLELMFFLVNTHNCNICYQPTNVHQLTEPLAQAMYRLPPISYLRWIRNLIKTRLLLNNIIPPHKDPNHHWITNVCP